MNLKRVFLPICLVAAFSPAVSLAQDLNKEITVEHDVVAERREAIKLPVNPVVTLDADECTTLPLAFRSVPVTLTPSTSILPAAASADSLFAASPRGYLVAGYFPIWNTAIAAGYRIIDKRSTFLKAWLQFDGSAYRGEVGKYFDIYESNNENPFLTTKWIRRNTATIGLSLNHSFSSADKLDISTGYTFDRLNLPVVNRYKDAEMSYYSTSMSSRNNNRVDLDARFTHDTGYMKWYAGGSYALFDIGGKISDYYLNNNRELKGTAENRVIVNAGVESHDDESPSNWSVDFSAEIDHYSSHLRYRGYLSSSYPIYRERGSITNALLSLTPRYRYAGRTFTLNAGVKLQGCFGQPDDFGKKGLLGVASDLVVAPDLLAMWNPAAQFAIWVQADGGAQSNTFSHQLSLCRFAMPSAVYNFSRTPINTTIGFRLGVWNGFALQARAGYVVNKEWLIPVRGGNTEIPTSVYFRPSTVEGGYLEAALSYDAPKLVTARMEYKRALSSSDKHYGVGYWLWNGDCARQSFRVEATVNPLRPLIIRGAYELRDHRQLEGTISDLSLAADYALGSSLTLFLAGENLLNRRYIMPGYVESRGITALVGFSLKF